VTLERYSQPGAEPADPRRSPCNGTHAFTYTLPGEGLRRSLARLRRHTGLQPMEQTACTATANAAGPGHLHRHRCVAPGLAAVAIICRRARAGAGSCSCLSGL
jgi:hypothetical protein